jgi:uroporphyrin-III C-methyltransferase
MGKVIFVGAGPGDRDLITVKGVKALRAAQVVLYDALLSTDLFGYCEANCKFVYVGKRKGKKEFSQDEINKLLVFYAKRFATVVRLKGGDPNVFGRGHEEASFVNEHGFQTETIPGVSSAIAAPNAAGIPLTKRGVNESFWVITGTLSNGQMSGDIKIAASSSATLIILMGVSHLSKIAKLICQHRSGDEPIAIIQNATFPNEKIFTATADTIETVAATTGIGTPAVIVVGQVVKESPTLRKTITEKLVTIS